MAKVKVNKKVQKKRKYPVKVYAPEHMGKKFLAEIHVSDLQQVPGKTVKLGLNNVMSGASQQSRHVTLRIVAVEGGSASSEVKCLEVVPYYLNRSLKKDNSLIESRFIFETKDGRTVVVKPYAVTRAKVSQKMRSIVRKSIEDFLRSHIAKMDAQDFMTEVVGGNTVSLVKGALKPIVSLKSLEFWKVEVK